MADPIAASRTAATLVWIDTEEAIIVRWTDRAAVEHLRSEIPGRHRATGHVRVDPTVRHGPGGVAQGRLDRTRHARLRRFLAEVRSHVPGSDDVMVVGPGLVRSHLERTLRAEDRQQHRDRQVRSAPSERRSEQELVAHVRELAGMAARRGP